MNVKTKVCLFAASALLAAGCQVEVGTPVAVVSAPGPVVEVAPPYYVWDGVEYVGEYNGGFVYLGPGGAWITCDAVVLGRWHGYERIHPDWRRTAVHYDRGHRPDPRGRGEPGRRPEERRREER
jgi:hypothetical protein